MIRRRMRTVASMPATAKRMYRASPIGGINCATGSRQERTSRVWRRRDYRCARRPDRSGRRGVSVAAPHRSVSVPTPTGSDPQQGHESDRCCFRAAVSGSGGSFRVGYRAVVGDCEPAGRKSPRRVVRRGMGDKAGLANPISRDRIMLLMIAVVLVIGHDRAMSAAVLTGAAQMVAGVVAGFVIGIVAALLGAAGGELLIPTLILLFGADIKLAGSFRSQSACRRCWSASRATAGIEASPFSARIAVCAGHGDRVDRRELHRRPTARHRSDTCAACPSSR